MRHSCPIKIKGIKVFDMVYKSVSLSLIDVQPVILKDLNFGQLYLYYKKKVQKWKDIMANLNPNKERR